jgi:septum formation protein
MTPVVLASASPRRKALLEALGIEVAVQAPNVPEMEIGQPRHIALENAVRKRNDAGSRESVPAIVIAADTVVAVGSDHLAKPKSLDEARGMIRRLSGRTHEVITAVAVASVALRRAAEDVEITRVTFRALSDSEIDTFVNTVKPLDRAGAYTVDGPGSLLVERYEGCYTNVLGLPMIRLDKLMRELGDGLFTRINPAKARFL